MLLPRALTSIPDARNALARLSQVFHAEVMAEAAFEIDTSQKFALEVKGAIFEWETTNDKGTAGTHDLPTPFQVRISEMTVPRGSLSAIVGPVGSGKVDLLSLSWW